MRWVVLKQQRLKKGLVLWKVISKILGCIDFSERILDIIKNTLPWAYFKTIFWSFSAVLEIICEVAGFEDVSVRKDTNFNPFQCLVSANKLHGGGIKLDKVR